jgi:hypothetical protein
MEVHGCVYISMRLYSSGSSVIAIRVYHKLRCTVQVGLDAKRSTIYTHTKLPHMHDIQYLREEIISVGPLAPEDHAASLYCVCCREATSCGCGCGRCWGTFLSTPFFGLLPALGNESFHELALALVYPFIYFFSDQATFIYQSGI